MAQPANADMLSFLREKHEDMLIRFEENQILVGEGISRMKEFLSQKLSSSRNMRRENRGLVSQTKKAGLFAVSLLALFSAHYLSK